MLEFLCDPLQGINAIGKMHEGRFPNIYILLYIIYYIFPLSIIIVLAIKALGFSKARQNLSNIFEMHYDKHQSLNIIFFIWMFYYFILKAFLL